MSFYEIVILYDKKYGEVIGFESDVIMNDSNDITRQAIKMNLLEREY